MSQLDWGPLPRMMLRPNTHCVEGFSLKVQGLGPKTQIFPKSGITPIPSSAPIY